MTAKPIPPHVAAALLSPVSPGRRSTAISEVGLAFELRRLRETFAGKHTVQFSKVMGYALQMEDEKWVRVSKRQFHNLVNAHVVAEGYEPRGLVWQLMCERIRDGVTAAKV